MYVVLTYCVVTILCVIEIALWRHEGDRIWLYIATRRECYKKIIKITTNATARQ